MVTGQLPKAITDLIVYKFDDTHTIYDLQDGFLLAHMM